MRNVDNVTRFIFREAPFSGTVRDVILYVEILIGGSYPFPTNLPRDEPGILMRHWLETGNTSLPSLKVGQQYRCMDGSTTTITQIDDRETSFPVLTSDGNSRTLIGTAWNAMSCDQDLDLNSLIIPSTVSPEVGKFYRRRDGEIVVITRKTNHDYPFWANNNLSYTPEGRYFKETIDHDFDLIEGPLNPNTIRIVQS